MDKSLPEQRFDAAMKSIMIVDDDSVDIKIYERAFNINRITNPVVIAHNGLEALDMLNYMDSTRLVNSFPEVMLLNMQMPKMNGIEFLKTIRKDPKTRPICVFVLTTERNPHYLKEAYDYNVAGYILKSFNFLDLAVNISVIKDLWMLCRNI